MSGLLHWLNVADTNLFLLLNGMHSNFFDTVFYWASNKWIWIPFYAWILFRLFRLEKKNIAKIILLTALLIAVSDQLSSGIIKKAVERPRPCHEAAIAAQIHLVNNYCGGEFGFVSSHAANGFALFTFLFLLLKNRDKKLIRLLLAWTIIVSYSRIYLGVHYPGDVICGALLGALLGKIFSLVYFRIAAS
jgi:undecaprenyl-diphosphatase